MTTHNDLHDVETMLRASLRERAGDVETTPALYERVQREAGRALWLRRGFTLAAVAAALFGAFVIVPALLPDPAPFDVVDTPEESLPSDTPTAAEDSEPAVPGGAEDGTDPFIARGLVVAEVQPDGTTEIRLGTRTVRSAVGVVSLATGRGGLVVAGLEDGSIGGIDLGETGEAFDEVVDAAANGGAVVPTPPGDGVAWIEGRDLHVLPLADGSEVRVLPLEGDVPDDLRIEQWFAGADAQVILASAPGGGLWSVPMDDSGVFDTAPTDPAFVLADDVVDGAILEDLSRVELALDQAGTGLVLRRDGDQTQETATGLPAGTDVALTTDGRRVALIHRGSGTGEFREDVTYAGAPPEFSWVADTITAVAPLFVVASDVAQPDEEGLRMDASELGLRTDAPVIGTDGIDLVIREADGATDRRTLYRPAAESEAVLGDLAVRPGSTATDGLVAIESFSEGETSVRFARLDDDTADPVGSILVTEGQVTGLVWSEDGASLAWTDAAGLHVVAVEADGEVPGAPKQLYADDRPVVDWVWTGDDDGRLAGWLAVRAGEGGTEFLGVDRFRNGEHVATSPSGGSDRLVFDTHASPGGPVGPNVSAERSGSAVVLRWGADGDQFGELASPGAVGSDPQVEVSGGQVVVFGTERHVLVTFDGDVVELPVLTDWDVLD